MRTLVTSVISVVLGLVALVALFAGRHGLALVCLCLWVLNLVVAGWLRRRARHRTPTQNPLDSRAGEHTPRTAMSRRTKLVVNLCSLAVVAAAAVCYFTGRGDALILSLLGMLMLVATELIERRHPLPEAPLPAIHTDVAGQLRQQRDESGTVAAVRRLRKMYPEISLLQAAQLVRDL